MVIKTMILSAFILAVTHVCAAQTPGPKDSGKMDISKGDIAKVAEGSNAFAMDLYAKLAADNKGNLFFSPASIDTALAMTYAGAKGTTADQMAKTLHLALPNEKLHPAFAAIIDKLNHPADATFYDEAGKARKAPAYQLSVANALWGQKGYAFRDEFTKLLAGSYGAAMNDVDFAKPEAAREVINNWVATQTKDKIKDLIAKGALDSSTRLVLTNAVYFKSNWAEKFEKRSTKDELFKLSADKTVDVPMMRQVHHFRYAETDDVQALELPYKGNELSMVIMLPKKADGLAALEKSLAVAKRESAYSPSDPKPFKRPGIDDLVRAKVDVAIPKFTFTSEFGLADTLRAMGMTDAFDASKADFSGMTSSEKLFVSAVIHKAFVAVDEEGTEAAAATAVMMSGSAMPPPEETKVFKADHPFVFLIRHNATGEILFMGRVANPK